MLHIGEHQYGVVDQVPGVMHVATRILHFNFLPIIPLGTVVSVDKKVAGETVLVKTRFSLKSIAFAYLRLALLWGAVMLMVATMLVFDMPVQRRAKNPPPPWFQSPALVTGSIAAAALLGWWWTHRLTHAGYARAIELADAVGLDREIIEENFKNRGLPTGDEFAPMPMEKAAVPDRWANEEKDDVYRLE